MNNFSKWFEIAPDLLSVGIKAVQADNVTCPTHSLIFKALNLVSPEDVKVVILGQDPYHTLGKASGLAFGYHPDYDGPIDSSLANILAEMGLRSDDLKGRDENRTLEHLPSQGVLLLNTCLTVLEGKPLSHSKLGWQQALLPLLKFLADSPNGVLWLLWGKEAHRMGEKAGVKPEYSITASHPCRFSNNSTSWPFTGSNCFQVVNDLLVSQGKEPISWVLK